MSTMDELLTISGAAFTREQTLRLPSSLPRWLDLRRLLFLGWVTIESGTNPYFASAKVHYRPSHWGIAGTRVHELVIWPDITVVKMEDAIYKHFRGNIVDRLDETEGGRDFLNLILEYFK